MSHLIIAMAAVAALYLCFVLVRPRRECAGNCGSCASACHDVSSPEDTHDVSQL